MNGKEHSDASPEDITKESAPVQDNAEAGSPREDGKSASPDNAPSAADAYKTAMTMVDSESSESSEAAPEQKAADAENTGAPSSDTDVYKTEMTMVDGSADESGDQTETQDMEAAETKTEVMPQAKTPGKASRKPGQLLAEGDKLGKYTINKRLGKGGMGEVYLATHDTLNIKRAIKILPKEIAEKNSQFLARFLREAKTACEIRHSNVVNVMDVETDEVRGLSYIVMEFVDGGDVRG